MNYLYLPKHNPLENECVKCQGSGYFLERNNYYTNNGVGFSIVYYNKFKGYENIDGYILSKHEKIKTYRYYEKEIPTMDHQRGNLSFCSCPKGQEKKFKFNHESSRRKAIYHMYPPIKTTKKMIMNDLDDKLIGQLKNGGDIW
jgi:hypothetical protein